MIVSNGDGVPRNCLRLMTPTVLVRAVGVVPRPPTARWVLLFSRRGVGGMAGKTMNENHIRAISSTLAFLDKALCDFEQWADGYQAQGVLYREENRLPPKARDAIRAEIHRIRAILAEMHDRLGLAVKTEDVATSIWAWCWTAMAPIEELEARHLRAYGEVAPKYRVYLDSQSAQLAECLREIATVASRYRPAPPPAGGARRSAPPAVPPDRKSHGETPKG